MDKKNNKKNPTQKAPENKQNKQFQNQKNEPEMKN